MRIDNLLRSLESLVSRRRAAGQEIATPQEILDRALRAKQREAVLRQVLSQYLPEETASEEPASPPESPSDHSAEHVPVPAPTEDITPPTHDTRPARRAAPAATAFRKTAPATRR